MYVHLLSSRCSHELHAPSITHPPFTSQPLFLSKHMPNGLKSCQSNCARGRYLHTARVYEVCTSIIKMHGCNQVFVTDCVYFNDIRGGDSHTREAKARPIMLDSPAHV